MVTTGKTIAGRRSRPESDSERERVRKKYRKQKRVSVFAVVVLIILLIVLSVKAVQGWMDWLERRGREEVVIREPSVEVIDEQSGQVMKELPTKIREYLVNLEDEFSALGRKITRARLPADKVREIDVEVEGFSGFLKISLDRNPAVSAEDGVKMIDYLEGQGINEVQYVDVRVERKGYWK
ncbi:hypothetical protein IJG20_02755 [Candidatus Saccharibacteria bacterium]|nr:hypothetical protein [Candidatus Saccharibacteria bacterium]